MRRVTIPLISLFITALSALGAEPTDYYKTCEGKHGKSLLQALQDVIDNHIDVSYNTRQRHYMGHVLYQGMDREQRTVRTVWHSG